jgi:hypothetical protein
MWCKWLSQWDVVNFDSSILTSVGLRLQTQVAIAWALNVDSDQEGGKRSNVLHIIRIITFQIRW